MAASASSLTAAVAPARAMEELIHSELLEEAHSAVSEWSERSKSKMTSAAAATAATAGASTATGAGTAASAKELRTPTKRVLPAAAMPPPTEDRAAALRLDMVTVRWQLPAEGGQVEAQHGRLTGQLRVLHDGRVGAEAAQPSGATSPSAHRSLRFECAGRECCLTVRRGGQAGGYEYELTVDGELMEAAPQVQPPSLSTPRARLASARRTEERANEQLLTLTLVLALALTLTLTLALALTLTGTRSCARRCVRACRISRWLGLGLGSA